MSATVAVLSFLAGANLAFGLSLYALHGGGIFQAVSGLLCGLLVLAHFFGAAA